MALTGAMAQEKGLAGGTTPMLPVAREPVHLME
jgi:hypothetical protein